MTKREILDSLIQDSILLGQKIIELQNAKTLLDQAENSLYEENWDIAIQVIRIANKNIDIDIDSIDQGLKGYIRGIEQLKLDDEEPSDPTNEPDPHPGYRVGQ